MKSKKEIPELAEPMATIIENVMADDRKWFEEHPDATERKRKFIMGEMFPIIDRHDYTVVTKINDGVRIRRFIDVV